MMAPSLGGRLGVAVTVALTECLSRWYSSSVSEVWIECQCNHRALVSDSGAGKS